MTEPLITPVEADELPAFVERSMREYVEQKVELGGQSREEAEASLAEETDRYFPGGRLREGNEVFYLRADGVVLGRIWLAMRTGEQAFVYDVQVEPSVRGKGYGERLMRFAEQWAREQGASTLGLHVFGDNAGAIRLYQRLGYATTDLMMRLDLSEPATT